MLFYWSGHSHPPNEKGDVKELGEVSGARPHLPLRTLPPSEEYPRALHRAIVLGCLTVGSVLSRESRLILVNRKCHTSHSYYL